MFQCLLTLKNLEVKKENVYLKDGCFHSKFKISLNFLELC